MKINGRLISMAGAVALLASGCMSRNTPEPEPIAETPVNIFDFEGLPSQDFYVGGGFIIRYRAHESGILYISEDHAGRLLGTISMTAGEKYEIVYDINDVDMVKNMKAVGIDPEKALIKVYFVPSQKF